MATETAPVQARSIPPRIAEAVAGIELLGLDLVDRSAILRAIEQIKGKSMGEIVREASLNPILEALRKGSEEKAEMLARIGNSEALREFTQAVKQSAEILGKSVDQDALEQLAQIAQTTSLYDELLSRVVNSDVLKAFTEVTKRSDELFSRIVNSSATINSDELKVFSKTFENTEVLGDVIRASVLQRIRKESQKLDDMIRLLKASGWLLPTQTRGWWEFAPGVRGGAYASGNPYMALIAALSKRPNLELAVTMESAAFMHRLSEHRPRKDVIAVPKGVSRQGSLGSYRQVELQLPKFASVQMDEIPVHSIAGLLAAMAIRPLAFRDWANVKKWLPKACDLVIRAANSEHGSFEGVGSLLEILESQSSAAHARAAYFFKVAGQVGAAEKIIKRLPGSYVGPVYLGSRKSPNAHAKYDSLTRVYDSLIDPK